MEKTGRPVWKRILLLASLLGGGIFSLLAGVRWIIGIVSDIQSAKAWYDRITPVLTDPAVHIPLIVGVVLLSTFFFGERVIARFQHTDNMQIRQISQPKADAASFEVVLYLSRHPQFSQEAGTDEIAASLTRAAYKGQITVWGLERLLGASIDERRMRLSFVPNGDFGHLSIAPHRYSGWGLEIIAKSHLSVFPPVYDDVMFSRDEIRKLWPSNLPWPSMRSTRER